MILCARYFCLCNSTISVHRCLVLTRVDNQRVCVSYVWEWKIILPGYVQPEKLWCDINCVCVFVLCILYCFLGRLPKVDLIILEGGKCPSVRPSTKSFFNFNEIWYIARGRWVMHDGMSYGRIQGQGHEPLKVWIPSIFKTYLLRHLQWELPNNQ